MQIMEPHPIPQNVTTFQFHLVGDMTLKQFLYLAAGSTIAYLLFIWGVPYYPLIAWPVLITSALLGIAFAFMPIASRPLDYWLKAFLKAVYSPTKRVWVKNRKTFRDDPLFASRLVTYLSGLQPMQTQMPTDYPLRPPLAWLREASRLPTTAKSDLTTASSDLPTPAELGKTVDLARQAQNLQVRIIQTERALNQIKAEASQPAAIPIDYSGQVNKIIADLQILVSQASNIRQQLDEVTKRDQINLAAVPPTKLKEKIRVVMSAKPKQIQATLTSFPNIINGVVKDKTGNYLEGTVTVIYDKEGLPVRALKTNKLGQFTGSTPLPNSTYTLELEKDNFSFDVLQIELNGQVLPPLLITSK